MNGSEFYLLDGIIRAFVMLAIIQVFVVIFMQKPDTEDKP